MGVEAGTLIGFAATTGVAIATDGTGGVAILTALLTAAGGVGDGIGVVLGDAKVAANAMAACDGAEPPAETPDAAIPALSAYKAAQVIK